MECSAIIISIVSLVISLLLTVVELIQNRNNNLTNLKSRYYEKIFDDFLIDIIPKSRTYIRFDNEGHLADFENLMNELSEMQKKSLYFKYDNNTFYKDLKQLITELEDYLSDCGNKIFENEEQADTFKEIHNKITKIYDCINNSHINSK